MTIGVDIDDTITETSDFINYYLKIYYPSYNNYHDLPDNDFHYFVNNIIRNLYTYELLKKHVSYVFNELKRLNHRIIFITARGDLGDHYEEDTINFLNNHKIPYDKIIFNSLNKGEDAINNKVDIFIDDKIEMCDYAAREGIDVIHIKGKEKSDYKEFDSWLDILEYIKSK